MVDYKKLPFEEPGEGRATWRVSIVFVFPLLEIGSWSRALDILAHSRG